jgi:hypothetical protein
MPEGAIQRALLALLVAGVLVYGLVLGLEPGAVPDRAPPSGVPESIPEPYRLPGFVPDGWSHLLYVVGAETPLPADLAPVVGIDAEGGVRILRAPPPPTGPTFEPWLAAGIQLPGSRLAALGPESRAALLALFRAWQGRLGRTARWRAVALGIEDPGELEVLARWER